MSNVGFNVPIHAGGCGGGATSPAGLPRQARPIGGPFGDPFGGPFGGLVGDMVGGPFGPMGPFGGGGFPIVSIGATAPAAIGPLERFVSSQSGGVIIGEDGAPAGRLPEGSFVDTKDGTIYGPDSKPITLPEGSTADFFDLPDIAQVVAQAKDTATAMAAATTAVGLADTKGSSPDAKDAAAGHASMMQSFVDGQWGPGGITPIKGGAPGGCDMDHAGPATKIGGSTPGGATTAVAGASGPGIGTGNGMLDSLNTQIMAVVDQVRRLMPTATSGGATLVAAQGASTLGSVDALRLSVDDLVGAIGLLTRTLHRAGIGGGRPGQAAIQLSPPPKVEPTKTDAPTTEAPVTEVPPPPPSSTSDTSTSTSTSDDASTSTSTSPDTSSS